ncbi:MAG: hypothetical protein PVH25_07635 [Burkholderiales bacterium]|jgi:hypothetical protein
MAEKQDPERVRLRDICRQVITAQVGKYGSIPEFFRTLAPRALPLRINEKDLYKVRSNQEPLPSYKKLVRLVQLFEEAGVIDPAAAPRSGMLSAIDSLSRISQPPQDFLERLPVNLLCFRNSYLTPHAINVSYIEISREGTTVHYNEIRVGTLADRLQNSEIRGTVVHREGKYFVLGLNEFRTRSGAQPEEEAHSDILVLTTLEQLPDPLLVFAGLHLGVTPAENNRFPMRPFSAPVFMIQTTLDRESARSKSLIRNYGASELATLQNDIAADAALAARFSDYAVAAMLKPCLEEDYGLIVSAPVISPPQDKD